MSKKRVIVIGAGLGGLSAAISLAQEGYAVTIHDKNARIGRNVIIRNPKNLKDYDGDNYYIRDGVVIITKNAVIPDGTKI